MTRLFWWLLGLTTLARLLVVGRVGLANEEAYHWNYAQHPDLSYFDHPPMVGWLIALTGGSNEFLVRLPAVLLFAGSCCFVFDLGRRMFNPATGLGAALLLNFLPIFAIFSTAMMPDSPHLFCWCAGLWLGWRLVESQDPRWWWPLGLVTGLGMLSKYPAALIPLPALVLGPRRWQTVAAALLALAIFSPVLIWNSRHEWASFAFQGGGRLQDATSLMHKLRSWFFQLGMVTPVGLVLVFWAEAKALGRRNDLRFAFLSWASLPFLLLVAVLSLQRFVNINWPLPGYLGASLLIAAFLVEDWPRRRAATVALATFGVTLSYLPWFAALVPVGALNPWDTLNGWREVATELERRRAAMPRPEETFYLGSSYQPTSQVAYYTRRPHHTLAQNAVGMPGAISYVFWEPPQRFRGWNALVVDDLRHPLEDGALQRHFERVEETEPIEIDRGGRPLRRVKVYRCSGFIPGQHPSESAPRPAPSEPAPREP